MLKYPEIFRRPSPATLDSLGPRTHIMERPGDARGVTNDRPNCLSRSVPIGSEARLAYDHASTIKCVESTFPTYPESMQSMPHELQHSQWTQAIQAAAWDTHPAGWRRQTLEPAPTNNYGPMIMNGGFLHQGDRYYLESENQEQRVIDRLLDSIRFCEMNLRSNQIADSHHGTYEWVFNESYGDQFKMSQSPVRAAHSFLKWLSNDQPLFWILGKPGSGKSTLMKFLANHKQTSAML